MHKLILHKFFAHLQFPWELENNGSIEKLPKTYRVNKSPWEYFLLFQGVNLCTSHLHLINDHISAKF